MYAIEEVQAHADAFRHAVRERQAFRPLYVKIKLIYGCNLRCAIGGGNRIATEYTEDTELYSLMFLCDRCG